MIFSPTISVASGFCHRLIVLDQGHIVESGPRPAADQPQAEITRTLVDVTRGCLSDA